MKVIVAVTLGILLLLPASAAAPQDSPLEKEIKTIKKDLRKSNLKTPERRVIYRQALDRLKDLAEKNLETEEAGEAIGLYLQAGYRAGYFAEIVETVDWAMEQPFSKGRGDEMLLYKGRSLTRLIRFAKAKEIFEPLREGPKAREVKKALADLAKVRSLEPVVGQPAPDINFRSLEGKMVNLSAFRGKVVLIDFWASWHGPSREAMPKLKEVYRNYGPEGFEVIGVSLDRDERSLKRYLEENKIPWPQYYDGRHWDNYISKYYGVTEIPSTFLIDRGGKLARVNLHAQELPVAVQSLLRGR